MSEVRREELQGLVERIVKETPVFDVHTHLYHPSYGGMLLWGPDELVTYHYLIAETFRYVTMPYADYWKLSKREQAELIWKTLFVERAPVSEACRGVLTAFKNLGFTVSRDLNDIRRQFEGREVYGYVDEVFEKGRIRAAVMTNDPFNDEERAYWLAGAKKHPRLKAALRIDPLLIGWEATCAKLKGLGYDVRIELDPATMAELRRFLGEWMDRMDAQYMAVSMSDSFRYPEFSPCTRIIEEAILPVCREKNKPFALMIGVSRLVNPALSLAGDGVDKSDVKSVVALCARYPQNKFMVTMLSREDQHSLCIAARKFRNLLPFGCWWFLNNPSLIEEMTRMRMETLGTSFIPQHSDARVLDQLLYKWDHSRRVIAKVLTDKYSDLMDTGWPLEEAEIVADVEAMLGGGNLEAFQRRVLP